MAQGYQYLIAQLPMYAFDAEEKDLIRKEAFLELAAANLSKADFAELCKANIANHAVKGLVNPSLRAYAEFEHMFREELAQCRRASMEEFEHKPALFNLSLIKDADPLELEVRLLRFRWEKLSEMEFGHHFDLDVVALFYLKLQLLYRKASFIPKMGWEAFTRICAAKENA
jgi:hypothetical protein